MRKDQFIKNWIGQGGGISWSSYWATQLALDYSSRSGLDLLETESGSSLDGKIIPSVSQLKSTDYCYYLTNNFCSEDSDGYIEARFYFDGSNTKHMIFNSVATAATARFFDLYVSSKHVYLSIRQNITTVFINTIYQTGTMSTGWHTARWISSGGAYSLVLDGATLTVGAGLTVSAGLNDGRWLNLVTLRTNIGFGCYKDSGALQVSAITFNLDYVDYNNKHKWIFHGQGSYVFDIIGTMHLTWTGTAHTVFSTSGSTLLLDSGFSRYKKANVIDEWVPYKAATPYDVSAFLVGYTKVSDHAGSAGTYNLAPSLVGFNETSSADARLEIFDRSNTTRQSTASRASVYYDATSLATKSRYHSTEIANPTIYNTLFSNGYRGMFYAKVTTATTNNNYFPITVTNFYTLSQDTKGSLQKTSMDYCGSSVFAATPVVYDADGYVLTLLTDIKHFGALPANTSEDNFTAIQRGMKYLYNSTLTFGLTGEIYNISQPIMWESYKTCTINSTLKIKNAISIVLTENYTAGQDHIHVANTIGFNIGEWVGITDNAQTYDYALWYGWNTWITNIDRANNIIYFNAAQGAACIFNYTTANGAWVGHAQSVMIADTKTNITLNGTGVIDCNQFYQSHINGLLPGSVFEELKSTSGFAAWVTDNILIQDLHFINGLRHNISITGTSQVAATRCDNIDILNVTSTFAHNKNCLIRYCDDVLIEDYIGNDAIWEDGLMFYLGNTNCVINNIECRRNGRHGVSWNGTVGTGLTGDDIRTSANVYAGVSITAAGATLTNLVMSDRLLLSNQYDNGNTISITNVVITDFAPDEGLYGDSIVSLLGAITNIALNELSISGCTGIGIYSTNQFTPAAPPVNVDITGGGIYDHTGTEAQIFAGSDIVFSDFDNYP